MTTDTEITQTQSIGPLEVDLDAMMEKAPVWREFMSKANSLPQAVRDVLFDINTTDYVIAIGSTFKLSPQQAAELSRIIRDILLGDLYIGALPQMIMERLGVNEHVAREIASRVMTEIFKPVLEDIKKVQLKHFRDQIGNNTALQAQAPPTPQQQAPTTETLTRTEDNPQNVINLREQASQQANDETL